MNNLVIEIELESETIFGNGESSTSFIDVEVLKDEYGIPYFKGKTFKGKLRSEVNEVAEILYGKDNEITSKLFGTGYAFNKAAIRFSNCEISESVKNNLIYGLKEGYFSKEELTNSFTDVRSFTKINENGVAEDGSLRQARVVKKGLKFYCDLDLSNEVTNKDIGILACGIKALRNLGTMESRGKGKVTCRLLEKGEDVTSKYIDLLKREVIR